MKRLLYAIPWLAVYGPDGGDGGSGGGGDGGAAGAAGADGAAGGGGNGDGGGDAAAAAAAAAAGEEDKPKFSQKQLNKILADDRRKHEERVNAAVKQLEEAKKAKGLSEQERGRLQDQIEEMKNSLLTKEEQAKKEREKQKKEYEKSMETERSEKEFWRGQFAEESTRNQIFGAALEFEAVSAEQLEAFLSPRTRLVEIMGEDGNSMSPRKFVPKIKFKTRNEKDEELELDLTIKEAVKRMKDEPERFGNLFRSGLQGGLGAAGSAGPSGVASGERPPAEPGQYRQWRKQRGMHSRK